jgi:hypothetical protein
MQRWRPMMASNSNLPNRGIAPAGEDKHWKFACNSGARVPGEKCSFANHHGLEAETGRKGRRAFATRSEASHKLISHPRKLAARAAAGERFRQRRCGGEASNTSH